MVYQGIGPTDVASTALPSTETKMAWENIDSRQVLSLVFSYGVSGGLLPSDKLMRMCPWMGSQFHQWIYYTWVAFSGKFKRITTLGSHIRGILGISKFLQVEIYKREDKCLKSCYRSLVLLFNYLTIGSYYIPVFPKSDYLN